jgi:hypothetical protein
LGPLVVTAAVAVLAFASSGVALAAALTHGDRVVAPPRQALPAAHSVAKAALRVSERLGEALESNYPNSYGGLVMGSAGSRIIVYMTRTPRGLARMVDALAPTAVVSYARSDHTLSELLAINRRLAGDWINLQANGMDIVGFKPDVTSSTEQLQMIEPAPWEVAMLKWRYGPTMISVQTVGIAPIPRNFTSGVNAVVHGGSWGALPIVAVLEAGMLLLVASVAVRARRTPVLAT